MAGTDSSCLNCLFRIEIPKGKVSDPEIVLVVQQQFLETCLCNREKLDFTFGRSGSPFASLGDILTAATGCLHHLVDGAVVALELFVGKIVGDIVDTFRFLECNEISIVAFLLKECFWHRGGGGIGPMGRIGPIGS